MSATVVRNASPDAIRLELATSVIAAKSSGTRMWRRLTPSIGGKSMAGSYRGASGKVCPSLAGVGDG